MDGLGDAYMASFPVGPTLILHSGRADVPCTNSDIQSPPIFDIPHRIITLGVGRAFTCVLCQSLRRILGDVYACVGSSLVYLFTG